MICCECGKTIDDTKGYIGKPNHFGFLNPVIRGKYLHPICFWKDDSGKYLQPQPWWVEKNKKEADYYARFLKSDSTDWFQWKKDNPII